MNLSRLVSYNADVRPFHPALKFLGESMSYLELWHDPPCMTSQLFQWYLREPLKIDAQGNVVVPAGPGLGIELDEEKIERFRT